MTLKGTKLSLDECVELINKLTNDFLFFSKDSQQNLPNKCIYKISSQKELPEVIRSARMAALQKFDHIQSIKKFAFDTRRVDQEHTRNPRTNLQYWNRSQQFIDEEDHSKIEIFAKLMPPLEEIKKDFGAEPEYFNSYARVLYDSVNRILRIKEADLDIFRPQLAYLEQLLYARYRLSLGEIQRMSKKELKISILNKDEKLLKRGNYLNETRNEEKSQKTLIKDSDGATQHGLINAIFGNSEFRRPGERTATRTITITIKDSSEDSQDYIYQPNVDRIKDSETPKYNLQVPVPAAVQELPVKQSLPMNDQTLYPKVSVPAVQPQKSQVQPAQQISPTTSKTNEERPNIMMAR